LKLLLDTHIWLWLFDKPTRLSRNTLATLKDHENELWLSPISVWEALTLHEKQRLEITEDLASWVQRATAGVKEAVLTHEIAVISLQLKLHKDPADRLIAATAAVLNMPLVTADERLLQLKIIKTLGNF